MMRMTIARVGVNILLVLALAGVVAPLAHAAGPQQAPPGQSEFVPVSELPPAEQLPAAPLLIAAYAVAWVALLFYLWSIWRRLGTVEKELADVARRIESGQRR
jgi:CcmD family protein